MTEAWLFLVGFLAGGAVASLVVGVACWYGAHTPVPALEPDMERLRAVHHRVVSAIAESSDVRAEEIAGVRRVG